jgi:inhibitor of cysteine peptidase
MKERLVLGMVLLVVSSLVLGGCGTGVSEEDYDAVVSERNVALAQVAALESDLTEAQTQVERLQEDYDAVVAAIDASYTGEEVEVALGGSFIVILESNPTTGFQWQLERITDEAVLELAGQEFVAPETALIGAGGKEIWTFKALAQGSSEISMEYRRPWEEGIEPANTFVLTVLVQ